MYIVSALHSQQKLHARGVSRKKPEKYIGNPDVIVLGILPCSR